MGWESEVRDSVGVRTLIYQRKIAELIHGKTSNWKQEADWISTLDSIRDLAESQSNQEANLKGFNPSHVRTLEQRGFITVFNTPYGRRAVVENKGYKYLEEHYSDYIEELASR